MDRFAFLEEDFGANRQGRDPRCREHAGPDEDTPSTVIETRLPDCAFIIRTIKSFLRQMDLQPQFVLHPIHGVIHDHGQITGIDQNRGTKYSQVYLQVGQIPLERREALRKDLEQRLELTLQVNRDRWDMMATVQRGADVRVRRRGRDRRRRARASRRSIPRDIIERAKSDQPRSQAEIEADEAVQLIDWLKDDNFILLGYAWFPAGTAGQRPRRKPEKGLGLFARADRKHLEEVIGEIVASRRTRDEVYSFYRTDYITTVRSVAQVRYFGIAERGPDGKLLGEHVFIGQLSTKALKLAEPPRAGGRQADQGRDGAVSRISRAATRTRRACAILDSMPLEDCSTGRSTRSAGRERVPARRVAAITRSVFVWRRPSGRRVDGGLHRAAHAVLGGAAQGALAGDPEVPPACPRCASTARRPTTSRRSGCTSRSASTARRSPRPISRRCPIGSRSCSRAGTTGCARLVFKSYRGAAKPTSQSSRYLADHGDSAGDLGALGCAVPGVVQEPRCRRRSRSSTSG